MTVRFLLDGHDRSYELMHIIKEAFSGVVFTNDENADVTVISVAGKNGITTKMISAAGENEYLYPYLGTHKGVTGIGHCVCISFLRCALGFGCREIPWGSLIGIRPSKMISNFRKAGYSEVEIKKILVGEYGINEEKYSLMLSAADFEEALEKRTAENAVCIYIGIPYCPTRCAYCSFLSRVCSDPGTLDEYIDCLVSEISVMSKFKEIKPIAIYIGGGTPTVLTKNQLQRLFDAVEKNINFDGLLEYTVEAGRPDTLTEEKLSVIKSAGAGRISINPQTLNDSTLERIGRKHTVKDFLNAYESAVKYGFDVINTDLIAGLPGESVEDFERSLDGIIRLSPENITVHTLALKRAAELSSEGENNGVAKEMHTVAAKKLSDYKPYYLYRQKNTADNLENTGYCKENTECIYNMCMMGDLRTVISFGAGGVTKFARGGDIRRVRNPKDADWYMKTVNNIIYEKENEIAGQINR